MRLAVLVLCCLGGPVSAAPVRDPPPDCTEMTGQSRLADAFEQWSRRGRIHEGPAAVCLERLEAAANDADARTANALRRARRIAIEGERVRALAEARRARESTVPGSAARAEADTTLGELLLWDEASTDAIASLGAALAYEGDTDDGRRLRALLAISRSHAFRRETESCLDYARAALALAEHTYGVDDGAVASALLAVATCHRLTGEHGASIAALERGLAIERAYEDDANHLLVAQILLMLAQTHKIVGDFPRAERGYHAALAYLQAHPEPAPRQLSGTIHGLANLERDNGRVLESLARYDEAVALFERVYGARSLRLSQVLNNYGNALGMVDRYDDAVAMYERALSIALSHGTDANVSTLIPVANIALVRLWQKRYDEADTGFRHGIELSREEAAGSESSAIFARLGLAASLWGQGRHAEAFAEAERGERERQLAVAIALARMSEDGAIRFQESLRPGLDLVIAIAHDSADPALIARAWTLAMAARGQVTTHVAARLAAVRNSAAPESRSAFERWREAAAALAELRLAPAADAAAIHAAEDALASAERALAAAAPAIAGGLHATAIGEVLGHLPTVTTQLVAFASASIRAGHEYAHPVASARARDVYAFVGRARQSPSLHRLLAEDELDALVSRWRRVAGDPGSAAATLRRAGASLRRRVFDPLSIEADALTLLVPYGDLHQINLAALPNDDGRYLIEHGLRVHALNHEHDLLRSPPGAAPTLHVLAVGDPAFALTEPDSNGHRAIPASGCGDQPWPPLPGSRREVEALTERLPTSARLTTLTGPEASRTRVLAALPGQHVIHIATHGLRRTDDCGNAPASARAASLALGNEAPDDMGGTGMLVLAGEPGTGATGGYLGEADIAALDLGSTRWIVLSACDTALGDSRAYEGAFGLRRAFQLAGAGTVIMSLWRVDDATTAEWMSGLYSARFGEHSDTPGAVHVAQASLLAARRAAGLSDHPYYWAGFIAAGDWR